jgi:hypothetical protein
MHKIAQVNSALQCKYVVKVCIVHSQCKFAHLNNPSDKATTIKFFTLLPPPNHSALVSLKCIVHAAYSATLFACADEKTRN